MKYSILSPKHIAAFLWSDIDPVANVSYSVKSANLDMVAKRIESKMAPQTAMINVIILPIGVHAYKSP